MVEKVVISTDLAPRAIGPYSPGIRIGNMVFTAGQIALVPATGVLVEGDIAAQTQQVLQNLQAIIEAAGGSMSNVVKTTVFLKSLSDFAAMNTIYGKFFSENPPARTTVEVAALPKGGLVEIEAVAVVD